MNRRRKIGLAVVITVLGLGAMAATGTFTGKKKDGPKAVAVVRGTLVDKALAVGTIQPRVEVSIKSILAGVVRRRFAEVGDFVKKGQPLLEVSPNPTPLEIVELRRNVELRDIELKNLERELARQRELRNRNLISPADFEAAQQRVDEARSQLSLAQERLALQEGGKVEAGGQQVETVVRAPIDGYILDDSIEIGDAVVPLTPYQQGTVLMRMAAMRDLIFRGTVDEIDVGRLREGMPVTIKIGALPNASVKGRLEKIWLKAHKEEQATVFPIEITLTEVSGATLRAGYSANAEVIIARRDSVLYIPERLITYRNDSSFVTIRNGAAKTEERRIKTGLSDAINIEVLEGVQPGDSIVEPPPREIT
ncbi:MAG TPA: efflux RND transporter periplasmic adaptor subunit [Gemmatimonadales bacterium]|nr:efflux RND transporter periplasmic adaptor subunit [Gemmatimonadales bacterium]